MASTRDGARRGRGRVEALPGGSLRVVVYAGLDPVTKRRHYLRETIPAGPSAARLAEKARTRLLAQVDERRHPRTNATVNQLVERHMELMEVSPSWVSACRTYHRLHIGPLIGHLKAGALDAHPPRLVLRRAAPLPRPLWTETVRRAPHRPRPPLRRARG